MNLKQLAQLSGCLKARNLTVTAAESCTGGLLAAALTELPGSSAWFKQSWVTYSNEAKNRLLGVDATILTSKGAVSEETVIAMAQNARRLARADYALSVSGIAGPDGGTPEKPVGTVWFALAGEHRVFARRALFAGNRAQIRDLAVDFAIALLYEEIKAT